MLSLPNTGAIRGGIEIFGKNVYSVGLHQKDVAPIQILHHDQQISQHQH